MEIFRSSRLGKNYSFIILLIFLFLMLACFPFFNQAPLAQLTFNLLFSFMLTAALYTVSTTKRRFYFGLLFIIPSLITRWLSFLSSSPIDALLDYGTTFLFLAFVIFSLSKVLFQTKKITINIVYQATCIYILLGIAWASIFSLIDHFSAQAFSGLDIGERGYLDPLTFRFELLLYFSYVTLTTLGYGDIVPQLAGVKFLSILEAITGQLYIATVIGRILGLYLSGRSQKKN